MKLQITMKTPDALNHAISEAVLNGLIEDDEEELVVRSLIEQWFYNEEYVTLEIDTIKKTCVVLRIKT